MEKRRRAGWTAGTTRAGAMASAGVLMKAREAREPGKARRGGACRRRGGAGEVLRLAPSLAAFLLFSPPLSWAAWAESFSATSAVPATSVISGSELERLSEISTRLVSLNERLRTELEASRRNSDELVDSLASSTRELATLRLELEASRRNSSELARRAELSERESTALREASTRAEDSLRSLEASFADYRRTAEARILGLSAGRLGLIALAVAGWGLAVLAFLL